ncbi:MULTISPECIES: hypothetical protein [Stenotrophomonas]|uniref:hypothetical protein n=1 Tax=Stenotrophomonas TaxID=40323 RepID=UPI000B0C1807|nr:MULTISPECIES: hypothetical protein [Stenotrophomonas]
MIETIVVMLVATALVSAYVWKSGSNQVQSLQSRFSKVPGFTASHLHVSADGKSAVGVDEARKIFCFLKCNAGRTVHRLVPYASVISADIYEDGSVISSASRSSQALGAAVGGLAFGVVGAIAGAVTGKRRETPTVNRIDLRVVVDDMATPTHDVSFLCLDVPRSGALYSAVSENARLWQARFDVAMRVAEAKASPEQAQ